MSENTYYADPESADEMTRLSHQGQMLNQALTLLPIDPLNRLNKTESLQVLDVGSGPGDWALELAVTYPFLRIISIDISERMVAYARARAESQETPNVEFWIMNALKPLGFPDASFDLVHIRAAVGFILREQWIPVFQECKRVLRPGGVLISTEGENGTFTYHSPNTAQLIHWLGRVLFVKGLGFWDGYGSMLAIHGPQRIFFRETGFKNIQTTLSLVDASFGTEQYLGWLGHQKDTVMAIKPIVCGQFGVSEDQFEAVLNASFLEGRQENFCSYSYFQTVLGQKP